MPLHSSGPHTGRGLTNNVLGLLALTGGERTGWQQRVVLKSKPTPGTGGKRLRIAYSTDFVPSVSAIKENAPRGTKDTRMEGKGTLVL